MQSSITPTGTLFTCPSRQYNRSQNILLQNVCIDTIFVAKIHRIHSFTRRGDCYRYISEFAQGEAKTHASEQSFTAYKTAMQCTS